MKEINTTQLKEALLKAKHIALTVHVHPDGDALGSMLAMYEALRLQGKDVVMVVDDVIPQKYTFLRYVEDIKSVEAITPEMAKSFDLLLVLDASTFERIGKVGALISAPIFNIDHHISNTKFASYLYLRSDFAATGEIVMCLLEEWQWQVTKTMAEALYMAIATDCGFFRFSNTTPHTLTMAARCVAYGALPSRVSEAVEVTTQERLEVTRKALAQVSFHQDGKVACLALDMDLMALVGDDTDGYVDLIRNVDTVDIAILLKAMGSEKTRVSLRSKKTDVNAVAAHFGGGGHVRAAGCTISLGIEKAKEALLQVISC